MRRLFGLVGLVSILRAKDRKDLQDEKARPDQRANKDLPATLEIQAIPRPTAPKLARPATAQATRSVSISYMDYAANERDAPKEVARTLTEGHEDCRRCHEPHRGVAAKREVQRLPRRTSRDRTRQDQRQLQHLPSPARPRGHRQTTSLRQLPSAAGPQRFTSSRRAPTLQRMPLRTRKKAGQRSCGLHRVPSRSRSITSRRPKFAPAAIRSADRPLPRDEASRASRFVPVFVGGTAVAWR